jgi:hypothetical protein
MKASFAKCEAQKAESRKQKAESRKQKAESRSLTPIRKRRGLVPFLRQGRRDDNEEERTHRKMGVG